MSTNFLSLPSELRNNIYERLLVLQEPVAPPSDHWAREIQNQELTPTILRVNKTIHLEASMVLYAQNRFDFTMCTHEEVGSFLQKIGRINASNILNIYIDFPSFHHLDLNSVTLEDHSILMLAKIQSDCTNLNTLTTSLDSTNAMEVKLDALDNLKTTAEAIALVDTCFRVISASLKNIIVQVYEDGPSEHIRGEMKKHGWTISTTKYVEEAEDWDDGRYFSDADDYFYGSGGDDYDIDNDSDFWRRAGD